MAWELDYALHEVPSGVLWGYNAASAEACEELLEIPGQFRGHLAALGDEKRFDDLIADVELHFNAHREYPGGLQPASRRRQPPWSREKRLPCGAVDPLAHTLFGAALAETGLRRAGRLATATLIIGANLPDVDATCAIAGENAALHLRRGLTHGVLAWVVLPWVLAGAMVLYDRLWRRRDPQRVPPPRFGTLLALAYLGVISHPALDWLNTYGVRLLMPFSERWFYGDTLFIVDPWMWLLPGGAVMLARAHTRLGLAAWMVLGAATTALVLFSGAAPVWARVLWCAGVAVIAVARFRGGTALPTAVIARVVLAAVVFYVAAMFAGGRLAERQAATWARAQGVEVEDVVAAPLPARLLQRDVVIATPDRYLFSSLDWLRGDLLRPANRPMPRLDLRDPVIAAALEAPQVRGFRTWVRYPSAQVERNGDGFRVTLFDVRYARTDQRRAGIGLVIVELDGALRPR